MCIFSNPILNVFATKIFGRLTGKGSQFLVYEMAYESEVLNAMILPLPVAVGAKEGSVRFVDLSDYKNFFTDMAHAFPEGSSGLGCSSALLSADKSKLEVHDVGDYVASFVPTLDDFDRLDPQFVIPRETWGKVPVYDDYGFVVFQLKKLQGKSHPMAFEFETRMEKIFFPTVHIHDGEVHEEEEFDHVLVAQHAGLDSIVGRYTSPRFVDSHSGFVRSKGPASEFCDVDKSKGILRPDLLLHRKEIWGRYKNQDMICSIVGDPLVPSFNWRKLTWLAPWAFGLGAVAWFFNRRSKIRQTKIADEHDEPVS